MRLLSPHTRSDFLGKFEELQLQCFNNILDRQILKTDDCWFQAKLPMVASGFGMDVLQNLAASAYMGGTINSMQWVTRITGSQFEVDIRSMSTTGKVATLKPTYQGPPIIAGAIASMAIIRQNIKDAILPIFSETDDFMQDIQTRLYMMHAP